MYKIYGNSFIFERYLQYACHCSADVMTGSWSIFSDYMYAGAQDMPQPHIWQETLAWPNSQGELGKVT
jgi:hypothetical protein